jgi:hypothetical protein
MALATLMVEANVHHKAHVEAWLVPPMIKTRQSVLEKTEAYPTSNTSSTIISQLNSPSDGAGTSQRTPQRSRRSVVDFSRNWLDKAYSKKIEAYSTSNTSSITISGKKNERR